MSTIYLDTVLFDALRKALRLVDLEDITTVNPANGHLTIPFRVKDVDQGWRLLELEDIGRRMPPAGTAGDVSISIEPLRISIEPLRDGEFPAFQVFQRRSEPQAAPEKGPSLAERHEMLRQVWDGLEPRAGQASEEVKRALALHGAIPHKRLRKLVRKWFDQKIRLPYPKKANADG